MKHKKAIRKAAVRHRKELKRATASGKNTGTQGSGFPTHRVTMPSASSKSLSTTYQRFLTGQSAVNSGATREQVASQMGVSSDYLGSLGVSVGPGPPGAELSYEASRAADATHITEMMNSNNEVLPVDTKFNQAAAKSIATAIKRSSSTTPGEVEHAELAGSSNHSRVAERLNLASQQVAAVAKSGRGYSEDLAGRLGGTAGYLTSVLEDKGWKAAKLLGMSAGVIAVAGVVGFPIIGALSATSLIHVLGLATVGKLSANRLRGGKKRKSEADRKKEQENRTMRSEMWAETWAQWVGKLFGDDDSAKKPEERGFSVAAADASAAANKVTQDWPKGSKAALPKYAISAAGA